VSQFKRILVTSALPYANGPIHLGHLAGAYLPADIFVRYHRLKGHDVLFICGSDEHGVPIMLRARQDRVSPQEVVDHYHERNKKSFKKFGISFDYYGRTTSKIHHQTSQDFFRTLAKKKIFVLKEDEQLFDSEANIFLADRFVRGTCPNCGYTDAYGDQCENCGVSLSPTDLKEPRSAVTNSTPVIKRSTHWYLPLSKYQRDLQNWINIHQHWKANVVGQINSWFKVGLKDRAVTRDLSWGVPVPQDIAREKKQNVKGKVLYVWFDAPIGYISATKEWALSTGNPDNWREYWQKNDTRLIHFIGKDNIVFHCIIFPAMLMLHGNYVLPENVPANEFLNLEGNKLSTSRNYAVWLEDYLKKFPVDSLRYCLTNILPETRDSDFSWKDFQARHNNELADILGNFVNRTLTFIIRHFDSRIPERNSLSRTDRNLIELLESTPKTVGSLIDQFKIREAVREIMDVARYANKYFNDQSPWDSIKKEPKKCGTTINLCAETIRTLSIILDPFIPLTTKKIRQYIGESPNSKSLEWDNAGTLSLKAGKKIGKPKILFEKIADKLIDIEIARLNESESAPKKKAISQMKISIEEFKKIDLRIAEILLAVPIEKTKNLLKLQVKIGKEKRQIIAGIASQYKPDELIGKKIVVIANLKSATIKGEESHGMLLAAKDKDFLTLIAPMEDITSGVSVS
jgi:methionyl-tRNA synthetase